MDVPILSEPQDPATSAACEILTAVAHRVTASADPASAGLPIVELPVVPAPVLSPIGRSTGKESADTINARITDNYLGEGPGREELVQNLATVDRFTTPPPDKGSEMPEHSSADVADPVKVTPYRCSLDGFMDPDRTLDSVHTYIVQDLADAAPTTIEDWLDLYLGVNSATYRQWCAKIVEDNWFDDDSIKKALDDYSATKEEKTRYKPFIQLLTRIIEMGRGTFHLDSGTDFPIDDVHLFNHSNRYVHPTSEHGNTAAQRKPDIIMMRKAALPEEDRAQWTDILTWFELKYIKKLNELLASVRAARSVSPTNKAAGAHPHASTVLCGQVRSSGSILRASSRIHTPASVDR